jgi:uncharacterized protein
LTANARHVHRWPQPSAQVVMCMDDREEGTRRHLEEVAPDIQTFGAAGFFGVAMYWQGVDDAARSALCPVVVTPEHAVREMPRPGNEAAQAAHTRRRATRLRWRERLYQGTRRQALAGPLLTAVAGAPALLTLAPSQFGAGLAGRYRSALATTIRRPGADRGGSERSGGRRGGG